MCVQDGTDCDRDGGGGGGGRFLRILEPGEILSCLSGEEGVLNERPQDHQHRGRTKKGGGGLGVFGGRSDRHRSWSHTGRGRSFFPEAPPSDDDMGLFSLFDPDREDLDMEISSLSNLHCGCVSTATVRARDGSGLGPGETGRIRIPSPSAAGQELKKGQGRGKTPTLPRRSTQEPRNPEWCW